VAVARRRCTRSARRGHVHWGNSVGYAVEVQGLAGFTGPVTLEALNLPVGATAVPVVVNVPTNGRVMATLNVSTAASATKLGPKALTLRATSPGVVSRSASASLRVLPRAGSFTSLTWRTGSHDCQGPAGVVSAIVGAGGQGASVRFSGAGVNTNGIPFLYYAFTPDCRGAVVYGSGPSVQLYNLGFDRAIANGPGQIRNFGNAAYDQTRFRVSSDGSYLIVVANANGSHSATLWSMLTGDQVSPPRAYSGNLNAAVVGDRVECTPSASNAFGWTLP
jgi:hypothetical protein